MDPSGKTYDSRLLQKSAAGVPCLITGDFNLIYQASDKNNLNINRRLMGKFRAAIDSCELLELCLQNRRFTWSNERDNPTLVCIDRAFCNSEWELSFPNFALNALSTGSSDHCPIVLAQQDRVPRKASFKFENHWLHLSGFKEIVQNAWAKQHNGSAHNVLKIKLNETARALKAWSKTLFRNARLQLQIANEVILRLDVAQESRRAYTKERSQAACTWTGGPGQSEEKTGLQNQLDKIGRCLHPVFSYENERKKKKEVHLR
jgi:hypothetical protein